MAQLRSRSPADPPAPPLEAEVEAPPRKSYVCDLCREKFQGEPEGAGLFVWTRGSEVRFEEPPLCPKCARRVAFGALYSWAEDESDEE
jgi:hypothetical protein